MGKGMVRFRRAQNVAGFMSQSSLKVDVLRALEAIRQAGHEINFDPEAADEGEDNSGPHVDLNVTGSRAPNWGQLPDIGLLLEQHGVRREF